MMPSRIPVAGVAVRGMPGVAVAIDLMRVVAAVTVTVTMTVATETVTAAVEAGVMPEIAVTAVAVRRIVMRTVAVIIVMLSLGERAKGEE